MIILTPSGIKNKPWSLAQAHRVELSNGDTMYIFKGYWTDLASIPFGLRYIVSGNFRRPSKDMEAFIIHDYLYNFGGYKTDGRQKGYAKYYVTRKFADQEMRYHMQRLGAGKLRRTTTVKNILNRSIIRYSDPIVHSIKFKPASIVSIAIRVGPCAI